MDPIVYAIPVFMLTILLEAWWARRTNKDVYDIPDALTSLHHGVISQVLGKFTQVGAYILVYEQYRATEWSTGSVGLWVLALLFYDLCYYWTHRMDHEVGVLWAAHVVHHSSEYYNLSTALRQTASGFLFGWIFYLPMAVAGVPPYMFVVVGLIDLLYQYWVHTELVGRLGWLDYILVTPSNHRVHHGQNDYCIDRNYGGIFIFWDHLFGTFEMERANEKICYGVRKPLHSFNPLWGNLHFYADLWKQSVAASGWRNKLGVWVAPPGGWTDGPIEHFDGDQFVRFERATPSAVRWYAAVQYGVTVPFISHFLAIFAHADRFDCAVYALGIISTNVILGALLERRSSAKWWEISRLMVFGLTFAAAPSWFGYQSPLWLRAVMLFYTAASALWMLRLEVASPLEGSTGGLRA